MVSRQTPNAPTILTFTDPRRDLSRIETVFANHYPILEVLIPLLSPTELKALFTPETLWNMRKVIDRLLNPVRCLGAPANDILKLLQAGYIVLLLGSDVKKFKRMMKTPYDSWIRRGPDIFALDPPRPLEILLWAWKPSEGKISTVPPPWLEIAHTDTDESGEIIESLEPLTACGFQPIRLGKVIHSRAKVNMCETDALRLYIGTFSRNKNNDHYMRINMWESDKFLKTEGLEIEILDLSKPTPQYNAYQEWGLRGDHPRPEGPLLHCSFDAPQYSFQAVEFFAEFDSSRGFKWL